MSPAFNAAAAVPPDLFERLTEIRVSSPEVIGKRARTRRRRESIAPDGRLTILACDHPARHVTRVGDNPLAMGDRRDYLARILRIVQSPAVDGVMATPDIVDDLLIADHLQLEAGEPSFLDGKVLLGCVNRGGLAGAVFELDDRVTAYTVEGLVEANLDGAKIMFRLDPGNPDSLRTMEYTAQVVTACHARHLPVFLEPLPVARVDGAYRVLKTAADLVRVVGVASALGTSSAGLWLKLPYAEGFAAVARATTLPILLLGGEASGDPAVFLGELREAMAAGSNVRGALVGRNVLYPGAGDPREAARAVDRIVRGSRS
jgi:DhnA family fructose-bisphosphate aldolase class Ia